MARGPRIVAELGRPETPDETADRKAQSSLAYRSSKTARNLIAALIVTLAVVVVIVFAVPRGEAPARPSIDVTAVAQQASTTYDRPVIAPAVPDAWRVNGASVSADETTTWTVVYAPDDGGFLRVSQGFDADASWATRLLGGAGPTGTVVIDGITWDQYTISDRAGSGNVSIALGTTAGGDDILIYGTTTPETAKKVAAGLTDQIRTLDQESK